MDDGFIGMIFGCAIGAVTFLVLAAMTVTTLKDAQRDYTECLSLQAPQDACLKKYLLPSDN